MTLLALTTPTSVRDFRGLTDAAKPPSDAWLDNAINALSARVEKALNRALLAEAQTETFSLEAGQRLLFLRGWPVSASPAFSLKYDALHVFTGSPEVSAALYHVDSDLGIVEMESDFTAGSRVLRAVYTGGMAATTAAFKTAFPDLHEAVTMQIAFWWESHARLGQSSVSGPDGSITLEHPLTFLPPLAQAIQAHARLLLV